MYEERWPQVLACVPAWVSPLDLAAGQALRQTPLRMAEGRVQREDRCMQGVGRSSWPQARPCGQPPELGA